MTRNDNPYRSPSEGTNDRSSLRAQRRWQAFKDLGLTVARGTSYATGLLSLAGFVAYPRPWASHWSPRKTVTVEMILLAGWLAMVAFLLCCVMGVICTRADLERKPLLLAMACLATTALINFLTPMV